jgi:hypothetical protein
VEWAAPTEILAIFNSLGIDPMKEGEVSVLYKNDDGTHVYDGFYAFTDKISIITSPVLIAFC